MIRHLVALRFDARQPPGARQALMDDLQALCARLPGVRDFRPFRNVSPETAVVHGFLDGFWIDFTDAAARDAYLVDSDHQAIGARLVAACDGGTAGLIVIDLAL